jgi:hypothetical protein
LLRRNPFIGIANGSKKKGTLKTECCINPSSKYQTFPTLRFDEYEIREIQKLKSNWPYEDFYPWYRLR